MNQDYSKDTKVVLPDAKSAMGKKDQVAAMFNDIAGRYDFLNHTLSLGIDHIWRKKAINTLRSVNPQVILDVATGTGDLAIEAARLKPRKIIGLDIAEQMLAVGRRKLVDKKLESLISFETGDSAALRFEADSFDALTCAYGVRNFEHLEKGLCEMYRVLKPGGRLAILEFSHPKKAPVKQLYQFYFKYILPGLGKMVSKNQNAYSYLPESVRHFPEGKAFTLLLDKAGFKNTNARPLTFGITTLYTADK